MSFNETSDRMLDENPVGTFSRNVEFEGDRLFATWRSIPDYAHMVGPVLTIITLQQQFTPPILASYPLI
jgi:hypothetical protein